MRICLALLSVFAVAACSQPKPPVLTELQIVSAKVAISIDGKGRARLLDPPNDPRRFQLSQAYYDDLVRRLEPFRRSKITVARKNLDQAFSQQNDCRTFTSDSSSILIQWTGASFDQVYFREFGCNYDQYASEDKEVQRIVDSLPLPKREVPLHP